MITTAPNRLTPTQDTTPVEQAAVDGIVSAYPPETFLWIIFRRPDGGARVWHAWTDGGAPLGDRIDGLALPAGLDAADWLHITDRHCQHSSRGRIDIQAFPLRPVLADVVGGVRSPEDRREALRRMVDTAAEMTGQTPRTRSPRWLGCGPALVTNGGRT